MVECTYNPEIKRCHTCGYFAYFSFGVYCFNSELNLQINSMPHVPRELDSDEWVHEKKPCSHWVEINLFNRNAYWHS